jgi:hypothetical protein
MLLVNAETEATIEVRVGGRAAMDHCLNAAVDRMVEVALRCRRHGILVTRLRDGHFNVELSDAVPYGYTEQRDARNKSC